jgi:hypothetical protein
MRSRVLAYTLACTAVLLFFIGPPSVEGAITHDPYEVQPGAVIPLKLSDFDEKGDVLTLTITFKGTSSEDYVPRGIDILILDYNRAVRTTRTDLVESEAIYLRKNVSTRIEEDIKNPTGSEKGILFFNEMREGDAEDWDNATVRIRIDYEVKNREEEEGLNFIPILIIVLAILIVAGAIVLVFFYFKRRSKDARTFFNPEKGPYYAFSSLIDGKTYYIDPDQYARLYESNSLGNYDFLGTAARIGGQITPPEGARTGTPVDGQMMTAVPIDGGSPAIDIASMEATPIPVDQPSPQGFNASESFSDPENASGFDGMQAPPPVASPGTDISDVPLSGETEEVPMNDAPVENGTQQEEDQTRTDPSATPTPEDKVPETAGQQ